MDECIFLCVVEVGPPGCDGRWLRLGENRGESGSRPEEGRQARAVRADERIEHLGGIRAAGQHGRPLVRTEPGHGDGGAECRRGVLGRNAECGARIGKDRSRFNTRRRPEESSSQPDGSAGASWNAAASSASARSQRSTASPALARAASMAAATSSSADCPARNAVDMAIHPDATVPARVSYASAASPVQSGTVRIERSAEPTSSAL